MAIRRLTNGAMRAGMRQGESQARTPEERDRQRQARQNLSRAQRALRVIRRIRF
jgi:hypothetical protein